MIKTDKSRRKFLTSGGVALSAGWLALNMPALLAAGEAAHANQNAAADYQNITAEQAIELGAFADQIIPPDDTPGAVEIGVVYFMDEAFGGFMAGAKPQMEAGLAEWNLKANKINPDAQRFSALSASEQTALLKEEENGPVFGMLHTLVLFGMFSSPQYGGNRDLAGWQLLGFDKQHAWQPPFGYYDARAMGSDEYAGQDGDEQQIGEQHV